MADQWIDAIRQSQRLLVYPDPGLTQGAWAQLFDTCLQEFNRLSGSHGLRVVFARSNDPPVAGGGGAHVSVSTASGQIRWVYGALIETDTLLGTSMHGRIFTALKEFPPQPGKIEKA